MLNFRKLKADLSPSVLKEGRSIYERKMVLSAKIVSLNRNVVRLSSKVQGGYENTYESQIEIDRTESAAIDSSCSCPHKYDCQHLAAVIYYLETHFDEIIVAFSKETDLESQECIDIKDKKKLKATIKEAETKEGVRKGKKVEKEVLQEYIGASQILGRSPFFLPEEKLELDKAELAILVSPFSPASSFIEIQLALRLPYRSKPLNILNIREFLDAVRYQEPVYIGSKRYLFSTASFDVDSSTLLKMILSAARFPEIKTEKGERNLRVAAVDPDNFGMILSSAHELSLKRPHASLEELPTLSCLYIGTLEEPLRYSNKPALLSFEFKYLEVPNPKILLKPLIRVDQEREVAFENVNLFESPKVGMIDQNVYYRFKSEIQRCHLRHLSAIRDLTIPEPLFGTFVENAVPELLRFAEVADREQIEKFVTLPFTGRLGAICDIHYLNGELEAALSFVYEDIKIPVANSQIKHEDIAKFVTAQGILARNLTEEQKIIDGIFQDFQFDESQGLFITKNEKKIIEFMTEVIPQHQGRVIFNCPENLLDRFLYDDTKFALALRDSERVDAYEVELKIDGYLSGIHLDLLWDCLSSKKAYIEITPKKSGKKKANEGGSQKILVLDLERLAPIVQIFDELGITVLDTHVEERPLWSLVSASEELFAGLPIQFSMTAKLKEIREQILGKSAFEASPIPSIIAATLRSYQIEGVNWLERLRCMHLNGVLADDMGLGKTLQAIIALTQHQSRAKSGQSIIVCPTSLIYNWKEEFTKFNPHLKVLPVDGTPQQRKKLLTDIKDFEVIITSYTLLQKDIEFYKTIPFEYAILDEAQHIKNRGTRNAKSVKMLRASHRLILTGTPIENSLDELWSLFDFLMPGLLSSYERFVEKYIRQPQGEPGKAMEVLRTKVSPFILRRMKKDVLDDLPPVSEIVYHCHLSETQRELYRSYAESAREELSRLVSKEGFDRVQIHVLATLTRLKQICCHPAIFAKEKVETGDSAKYDMLLDLVQTLIEGRHKTVIFSQYTRMLQIMREDLMQMGVSFSYLDGSSKDRLKIVNQFNQDDSIPIFLVSLKAGGTGLNLVGADTVIHYDMWWNPAVENQATDRVHRIGQKSSVSSYKLVTLNTIEEKILEMQNRKKGLVKKIVNCDEDAISKLTWEEVLELLKT